MQATATKLGILTTRTSVEILDGQLNQSGFSLRFEAGRSCLHRSLSRHKHPHNFRRFLGSFNPNFATLNTL